jgi:hypothetical protein
MKSVTRCLCKVIDPFALVWIGQIEQSLLVSLKSVFYMIKLSCYFWMMLSALLLVLVKCGKGLVRNHILLRETVFTQQR